MATKKYLKRVGVMGSRHWVANICPIAFRSISIVFFSSVCACSMSVPYSVHRSLLPTLLTPHHRRPTTPDHGGGSHRWTSPHPRPHCGGGHLQVPTKTVLPTDLNSLCSPGEWHRHPARVLISSRLSWTSFQTPPAKEPRRPPSPPSQPQTTLTALTACLSTTPTI